MHTAYVLNREKQFKMINKWVISKSSRLWCNSSVLTLLLCQPDWSLPPRRSSLSWIWSTFFLFISFGVADPLFIHKIVENTKFQVFILKCGVFDHFMGKKRVDNTKFKTNLTVQAVYAWSVLVLNKIYSLMQWGNTCSL